MRARSHDQGFVAARPDAVYEAVADVGRYGRWWPGVRVEPGEVPTIALDGRRTVTVRREREREGVALFLALGPPYRGTLEWYLEPFEEDGTIVNCLLDVELPGRGRRYERRLRALRSHLRQGLVGLKRALE